MPSSTCPYTPTPPPPQTHLSNILFPPSFLFLSLTRLPPTILASPRLLLSPQRLQSEWFASFWSIAGPRVRETAQPRVVPLLEGRIRAGAEISHPDPGDDNDYDDDYDDDDEWGGGGSGKSGLVPSSSPPLRGVVVEVGAGSGMWMDLLAVMKRRGGPGGIQRVLGIEPNAGSRAALARRVEELKAEDWYCVVASAVDDDDNDDIVGIKPGCVDSVVCVLVLCSVPDPAATVRRLYDLLRKGGTMYVYEHVEVGSRGGWGMWIWQRIMSIFWSRMVGGCQMCRPTESFLRGAGPWKKVDLAQPVDEPWSHTLPHIIGTLTK